MSATYLIVTFMFIHASFHTANIFFARLLPATVEAGRMHAPWLKLFMLEAFLNVIVLATACLMLIKERSEQRHRIASETDVLTGIANRRAFVKHTETALKNATPSAILAVFDLDHFKTINDRFGHQAGDAALIHFAHTLKERLPDDVLFGRMGGEEFALYVPDHNERDALVLVDGLRRAVETSDLRHLGEGIDMTVSVGVATVEDAGLYLDSLMAAADCALYQAKEDGRNRVVSFSPSQRLNQVIERDGRKRFGLAERRVSRRVARPAAPVRNVLP